MSPTSPPPATRIVVRLLSLLAWFIAAAALLWAFLALTVSFPIAVLRWPVALSLVAIAFVAAIRLSRRPFGPAIAWLVCAAPVFLWWLTLTPRNDRRWQPDMERIPWAEISGDNVTLHNFRNTDRRTLDDFTPRWETRVFRLSSLKHLDFYLAYWGSQHVCHTMITFDFGAEGRVCASIEARREGDESYSPVAGAFRRYELMYVLGDERDIVRRRTPLDLSDQVYLFRIDATPEIIRGVFLDYLAAANRLHTRAEWYHSLTTNCSTLIYRHVKKAYPDALWDWRIVANGHADRYLYAHRYLDRSLPFPELKNRSLINHAASAASDAPDFSERIRAGRPGF